jgi:hypothetical protein
MCDQNHDKPENATMNSHTCRQPGKTTATNHTSSIDENKKMKTYIVISMGWAWFEQN